MKYLMPFLVILFSASTFANEVPTRSELVLATGKVICGDSFQQNQQVLTKLTGKNGCEIEIEIESDSFLLQGQKGSKFATIQPFRPTLVKLENINNIQSLYFESEGPCDGGLTPGSASCDKSSSQIKVTRNTKGVVQEIELRTRVNKIFQFTDVVKCQFE